MSLTSALNAAISGLNAYSRCVGTNADNIAKGGAVAAKARECFVVTQNSSDSVQQFTPGGVSTSIQQYITDVGDTAPAELNTFMAINGQGMLVVNSSATPATGTIGFSRVGTFDRDAAGNIKNTSGQYLMVFPTDATGAIKAGTDTVTTAGLVVASTAGLNGAPVASTNVKMGIDLPSGATLYQSQTVPINVVDSLGVSHIISVTWTLTTVGTPLTPPTWSVSASSAEAGVTIAAPYVYTTPPPTPPATLPAPVGGMPVTFDANGNPITFNGATTPPNLQITWNSNAAPTSLTMFMGTPGNSDGVRANAAKANLTGATVDGRVSGNYQSLSISSTGLISAVYDNQSIVPFAQIPMAMFTNFNGLLEASGGVFSVTSDSGPYQLTIPGQNGSGGILTSFIEESKIDSTNEFTDLIVNQTNYSYNGKVIAAARDMMQELLRNIS
ncbi:flagellar hook-basal body complex protein [Candidatus Paracaedibacter symbiosus]|uniref:flagellar hook-basal body complex protein n=1 Tax=Candidatus Paracaedibacter symbiosus TaxID=244582 RepID=UPI0005094286|nr:flagellar hook-basal body complex protein [Candidatus Paracaedibacter symbiosus]